GNSASAYHSFTPGSGSGTLTTVDINTIGAHTMRVELSIKHTLGVEAGDIDLYYYDGTAWDFIADLNSIGPNDVWRTYTDDVNESEYLISNFKLELRSSISAGEVFVDNVSVTNTWPILNEWLVYSGDANSYTPPGNLDYGTTYYWRVDEVNDACSASPWRGYLWEFTTETGKARSPSPDDHAGFIPEGGTTLGWTSSCLAASGDYLYFGTDFNDVNSNNISVRFGPLASPTFPTGALVYATKYYWKVNAVGGSIEGDVWSFQTTGYPLMYFKFDGVLDANVGNIPDANFLTDSTGNVTFSVQGGNGELKYGEANPLYNTLGTSAHFTPDGSGRYLRRHCFGADLLDLDGPEYTIEAWVRQDGGAAGIRDGDLEGTIVRKDHSSYGLGIDDDGAVKFMHSGAHFSSGDAGFLLALGEWHHIAAVYDESDPNQTQKIYINGILVADNNEVARNPVDDNDDIVGIGAFLERDTAQLRIQNYFNGAIDELRVIDIALTPNEFLIRGDPNLAWLPRPYNYATEVLYDVDLEWNPGDYASSHEVYFGTNWYEVNDANNDANYWPGVFKGKQDPCTYDLSLLDLGTTYYWRIDEVNDTTNDRWTGSIWRFEVAEYIIIDNFDDDTAQDPPENDWWKGSVLGTGATISLRTTDPVIGEHSMRYDYSNFFDWGPPYNYYSEIQTKNLEPNDWD
ncbi:MAG: LamG domain-containing protein, partial [Planctomycetota bacterium]